MLVFVHQQDIYKKLPTSQLSVQAVPHVLLSSVIKECIQIYAEGAKNAIEARLTA